VITSKSTVAEFSVGVLAYPLSDKPKDKRRTVAKLKKMLTGRTLVYTSILKKSYFIKFEGFL
jgi:hypothetical protein